MLDAVEKHYNIHIEQRCRPSLDAKKAWCRSTKMGTRSRAEPGRMLKGVHAWITKQRKDQSLGTRANIPVVQVDCVFGDVNGLGSLIKWNPVANVDGKGLHRPTVPSYQVADDGLYNHVTGDGSLVVYGVGWPTRWGSSALMLRKPVAQKELEPVKFLFFHKNTCPSERWDVDSPTGICRCSWMMLDHRQGGAVFRRISP